MPDKRAKVSEFCTAKCEREALYDADNFGSMRRAAVGFNERRCWICKKVGLGRINVHHVYGRELKDLDIYVVLCQGCHMLVYQLCKRLLLDDPKKVADLISLARHEKMLPNAKVTVVIETV